jgi:hypothetical protein
MSSYLLDITLAKILGHADLSLLMRYVHPSQGDMDRAMEWFNGTKTAGTGTGKNAARQRGWGSNQPQGWSDHLFDHLLAQRWSNSTTYSEVDRKKRLKSMKPNYLIVKVLTPEILVRPVGFEPTTFCSGGKFSASVSTMQSTSTT